MAGRAANVGDEDAAGGEGQVAGGGEIDGGARNSGGALEVDSAADVQAGRAAEGNTAGGAAPQSERGACEDAVAEDGERALANPLADDDGAVLGAARGGDV